MGQTLIEAGVRKSLSQGEAVFESFQDDFAEFGLAKQVCHLACEAVNKFGEAICQWGFEFSWIALKKVGEALLFEHSVKKSPQCLYHVSCLLDHACQGVALEEVCSEHVTF